MITTGRWWTLYSKSSAVRLRTQSDQHHNELSLQ